MKTFYNKYLEFENKISLKICQLIKYYCWPFFKNANNTTLFILHANTTVSLVEWTVYLFSAHLHPRCASGEKGTLTHGSVVDGRFEGFIKSHQGTYYIEPSERYLKDQNVPFHSIIYHEDDISEYLPLHLLSFKTLCAVEVVQICTICSCRESCDLHTF